MRGKLGGYRDTLLGLARTKPGPITEVACVGRIAKGNLRGLGGQKSPVAKEAIDRIAAVYAIEAEAQFAPVDERVRHRAETAPLMASLFEWAEKIAALERDTCPSWPASPCS
jgi:transposase